MGSFELDGGEKKKSTFSVNMNCCSNETGGKMSTWPKENVTFSL